MKSWTTKEIAYLKRYAILSETNQVLNIPELAKKLERTNLSVDAKIRNLQREGELPQVDHTLAIDPHRRGWSKKELERIIHMANIGAGSKEIADSTGRTVRSIENQMRKLRAQGRLEPRRIKWKEYDTQLLVKMIEFDKNGFVANYPELCQALGRQRSAVSAKIVKLRKEKIIKQQPDKTTQSVKSKKVMNNWGIYTREVNKMEINDFESIPDLPVESKEVTLILTTMIFNDQKIEQYFTKDGQLIAHNEAPISFAGDIRA